ncbi:MAG TPA: hypothetical protein VH372_02790, partial [Actinospica sp.]|nr:hypothetical protein [Actinospica sp.]
MRLAQRIKRALGLGSAQAKQRGDRSERERPERHGAKQAELGEPVTLGGQPACHRRDAPAGPRGEFGSDDTDRQRQPRAGAQDLLGRLGLRPHPSGADDPGEQLSRLGTAKFVQVNALRADEIREPRPAGDDDRAAGGTGQKRAHLGRVPGVIEHDEHPAAGEQAPVARRTASTDLPIPPMPDTADMTSAAGWQSSRASASSSV